MATEGVDGKVGGAWGRGRGYMAWGWSHCMATKSVDGKVGGAWGRGRGPSVGGRATGLGAGHGIRGGATGLGVEPLHGHQEGGWESGRGLG